MHLSNTPVLLSDMLVRPSKLLSFFYPKNYQAIQEWTLTKHHEGKVKKVKLTTLYPLRIKFSCLIYLHLYR